MSAPAHEMIWTTGDPQFPLSRAAAEVLVRSALDEDHASDDVTSLSVVPAETRAEAVMVARSGGVIAGLPLAMVAFELLDSTVRCTATVSDGAHVVANTVVLEIEGPARAVLSAERVALNFAQRMSGIATLTSRFVAAVRGTRAKILDTRKTTPGLRALEKYAVLCGGGKNHRADLAAAVLIKDNHLEALGGNIALAVRRAREKAPAGMQVEVECDRRDQVSSALAAGADVILLDNMTPDEMRSCVELVAGAAVVEASGGITLDGVRAVAESGVDWISIGALTHSVPALDLGLDFRSMTARA